VRNGNRWRVIAVDTKPGALGWEWIDALDR